MSVTTASSHVSPVPERYTHHEKILEGPERAFQFAGVPDAHSIEDEMKRLEVAEGSSE